MENLEELKAIVDNAPDGATNVDYNGEYIRASIYCEIERYCSHRGWFEVDNCDFNVMRSIVDIERIIELMEIVEDAAALGFLTPSFDSGVSHKQLCKKYEAMKL